MAKLSTRTDVRVLPLISTFLIMLFLQSSEACPWVSDQGVNLLPSHKLVAGLDSLSRPSVSGGKLWSDTYVAHRRSLPI